MHLSHYSKRTAWPDDGSWICRNKCENGMAEPTISLQFDETHRGIFASTKFISHNWQLLRFWFWRRFVRFAVPNFVRLYLTHSITVVWNEQNPAKLHFVLFCTDCHLLGGIGLDMLSLLLSNGPDRTQCVSRCVRFLHFWLHQATFRPYSSNMLQTISPNWIKWLLHPDVRPKWESSSVSWFEVYLMPNSWVNSCVSLIAFKLWRRPNNPFRLVNDLSDTCEMSVTLVVLSDLSCICSSLLQVHKEIVEYSQTFKWVQTLSKKTIQGQLIFCIFPTPIAATTGLCRIPLWTYQASRIRWRFHDQFCSYFGHSWQFS